MRVKKLINGNRGRMKILERGGWFARKVRARGGELTLLVRFSASR